eukprot:655442-Pyramimonas_sp.AAC.2
MQKGWGKNIRAGSKATSQHPVHNRKQSPRWNAVLMPRQKRPVLLASDRLPLSPVFVMLSKSFSENTSSLYTVRAGPSRSIMQPFPGSRSCSVKDDLHWPIAQGLRRHLTIPTTSKTQSAGSLTQGTVLYPPMIPFIDTDIDDLGVGIIGILDEFHWNLQSKLILIKNVFNE